MEQRNYPRRSYEQTCRTNDHELTIHTSGDWHLFISFWFFSTHFFSISTLKIGQESCTRLFLFFLALTSLLHTASLSRALDDRWSQRALFSSWFLFSISFAVTLVYSEHVAGLGSHVERSTSQEKWASGSWALARSLSTGKFNSNWNLRVKHETWKTLRRLKIADCISTSSLWHKRLCRFEAKLGERLCRWNWIWKTIKAGLRLCSTFKLLRASMCNDREKNDIRWETFDIPGKW